MAHHLGGQVPAQAIQAQAVAGTFHHHTLIPGLSNGVVAIR